MISFQYLYRWNRFFFNLLKVTRMFYRYDEGILIFEKLNLKIVEFQLIERKSPTSRLSFSIIDMKMLRWDIDFHSDKVLLSKFFFEYWQFDIVNRSSLLKILVRTELHEPLLQMRALKMFFFLFLPSSLSTFHTLVPAWSDTFFEFRVILMLFKRNVNFQQIPNLPTHHFSRKLSLILLKMFQFQIKWR